jgi:uncharacterized membrane protein
MQPDSQHPISTIPADTAAISAERLKSYKNLTMIAYGLYALGLFLGGVPTIIGLVIAYIKRGEYNGTIYGEHLRFLIRTFWYGVLWTVVGLILSLLYVGFIVMFAVGIWYIYRIVRGFLCLNDGKGVW